MKGYLIVNDSLKSEKYKQIEMALIQEAKNQGIELILKTNAEMFFEKELLPFAIFYDKDITLAKYLEDRGVRLFNSKRAIEICDDKALTYLELEKFGIKQPKTFIAPLVFGVYDWEKSPFIKNALENLSFPIVVKERFGSFGAQVHLANSKEEMLSVIKNFNNRPFILQEYIGYKKGVDLRVEVIAGKVVASMERRNENDFRANLTNGGIAINHTLTDEEENLATKVASVLKLDFCGVDIIYDKDSLLVCEVNSNAHFYNLSKASGINVAKLIIEHIKGQIK